MRNLITLSFLAIACSLSAQLQNGGFEALDTAGIPTYWTSGIELITIGDSIVVDSAKYLLNTTDVHSGANATELRNAYDFTQNIGLSSRWYASPFETAYGGFPSPDVPLVQRPATVRFWCGYAPMGGDTGYAEVKVTDALMTVIGSGMLHIGSTSGTYAEFELTIAYSSTDSAAYINIGFNTIVPGGNAHLGTRMLIDDVSIDYVTTGIPETDAALFRLFPNPADDEVRLSGSGPVCNVRVLDAMGREALALVTITDHLCVRDLRPGSYVVETWQGGQVRQSRLMIAR